MHSGGVTSVIIAGVGGQGNILASKILAECARIQKKKVIVGEVFGVSQRGGSVMSHVRIGDGALSPISSEHGTEIICGLEPMETLRAASTYAKREGVIVTNVRSYPPVRVNMGKDRYPAIDDILNALRGLCSHVVAFDATELAKEAGGEVLANIVLIGAVSTIDLLDLPAPAYEEAIAACVPRYLDQNLQAFRLGRRACPGGLNHGRRKK